MSDEPTEKFMDECDRINMLCVIASHNEEWETMTEIVNGLDSSELLGCFLQLIPVAERGLVAIATSNPNPDMNLEFLCRDIINQGE